MVVPGHWQSLRLVPLPGLPAGRQGLFPVFLFSPLIKESLTPHAFQNAMNVIQTAAGIVALHNGKTGERGTRLDNPANVNFSWLHCVTTSLPFAFSPLPFYFNFFRDSGSFR